MNKERIITPTDQFFDEDGFLRQPQIWNEQIARLVAKIDGLDELTEAHWRVIRSLRDYYAHFGAPPMCHHVSLETHMDKHCVEHLFHTQREAWRVAGLPNPGEEAKAYM